MTTNYKCIAKRMTGGRGHEHIQDLRWVKCVDGKLTAETGVSSRAQMVQFIRANGPTSVWCPDRNPSLSGAWVHAHSNGHIEYVQTVADGRKTDNLLSLPDF